MIILLNGKEIEKIVLINLVIKQKDLPLAIIGRRLRMRLILALLGLCISAMAVCIGVVRRMRILFGALEEDIDF